MGTVRLCTECAERLGTVAAAPLGATASLWGEDPLGVFRDVAACDACGRPVGADAYEQGVLL